MFKLDWTGFKDFCSARSVGMHYNQTDIAYELFANDDGVCASCKVGITIPANSEQTDFETNYKSSCNVSLTDSTGRPIHRMAITRSGFGLQCQTVEFETSKLSSVHNKDKDNDDLGFAEMKFYDASDNELTTQTAIDSSCVRTDVLWEPTYDFEIIGGEIWQQSIPSQDVYTWFYNEYSGHEFCSGGLNLKFLGANGCKKMDGRAPKLLPYNETYHTNRMVLVARHPAGFQHKVMFVMEFFKP